MTHGELIGWLHETDERKLKRLYERADEVRRRNVGDQVHLRGLVEISNYCRRHCLYCGLRAPNRLLARYRMTEEEALLCARRAVELGYGTLVLQAGEDVALTREFIRGLVHRVKKETGLAVTLSLGERSDADLAAWRAAGADRYLLRFETSNAVLFHRIHPPSAGARDRFEMLAALKRFGYEVGSGVMVGIPGQTMASLATDLILFSELDLDMIGIGPFLPHPETPLGNITTVTEDQAPATEQMVYKTIAVTRLLRPDANIPATTALATLNTVDGRKLGLTRGANVVMPNLTPAQFRILYEIYPGKVGECEIGSGGMLQAIGRIAGKGPGGRRKGVGLCA